MQNQNKKSPEEAPAKAAWVRPEVWDVGGAATFGGAFPGYTEGETRFGQSGTETPMGVGQS